MENEPEIRIKRPLNHATGEADCPQCESAKSMDDEREAGPWETCVDCGGSGEDGFDRCHPPNPYLCDTCHGTGKVAVRLGMAVEFEKDFMTKTTWKYPLKITDEQNLIMPEGAEILTVQMQGSTLCLWALVDPSAPLQRRIIEILGTGNPAPGAERKYISTAQMAGGSLIWHIFERPMKASYA